jgi:hypothetical protein
MTRPPRATFEWPGSQAPGVLEMGISRSSSYKHASRRP